MADVENDSTKRPRRVLMLPELLNAKRGEDKHGIREALAQQVVARYRETIGNIDTEWRTAHAEAHRNARRSRGNQSAAPLAEAYAEVLRRPHPGVPSGRARGEMRGATLAIDRAAVMRAIERVPIEQERWRELVRVVRRQQKNGAHAAVLIDAIELLRVIGYGPAAIGGKLGLSTRRVQQLVSHVERAKSHGTRPANR